MVGNTSSICKIEAREAIDQALIAGESNRAIASQYGLSHAAVRRHSQNHLSATLLKSAEGLEMATGRSFWTVLTGLWIKLWLPVELAATKRDERGVKPGIREARHSLELTGRITGELRENNRQPVVSDRSSPA